MQAIKPVIIAAVVFVAWTVYDANAAPVSTVAGKTPIDYKPDRLAGWKGPTDGLGTLTISDSTGPRVRYVVGDNGVLVEDPSQTADSGLTASFQSDRYVGQWSTDVGGFASVDDRLRLGIRYSPTRLAWGYVAPDIVASESAVGLGISIFPWTKSTWHGIGAGCWYVYDLDSHDTRFSFGLSSSIR